MTHHERIVSIFIYCTRDHNLNFHPDLEYLQNSRMQAHWFQFEYLHTRFAQKAAIGVGVSTARIMSSTGMGVVLGGLTGGPAGAVSGLALGAIGATTAQSVVLISRNIRTKIGRQWRLHKGRSYALKASVVPTVRLFYTLTPYDFWPGYESFRRKRPTHAQDDFALQQRSNIFENLKVRLYFKPPKSGDRLNRYNFEYFLLEKTHLEEAKNADILWNTSSCWPMLDYIFFNQYFYFESRLFCTKVNSRKIPKQSECIDNVLKCFFYTTRFYFLARDFYLDHFFDKALPRYEMALTHQNHLEIGANILKDFFQASKLSARDLLNEFQNFITYLPEETQIAFRRTIRSLATARRSALPSSFDVDQDNLQAELDQNQKNYDTILTDTRLTETERRMRLRHVLEARRLLMRNASQFVERKKTTHEIVSADLTDIAGEACNPIDISIAFTRHIFTQTPHSETYSGNAEVDSFICGGINGTLGVVADFATDGFSAVKRKLQKQFGSHPVEEIWTNLERFYGGVRLLCGTVDFVYHAVTGSSLLLKFFKNSAILESVVDPLLLGSNIVNIALAYAIQNQGEYFHTQMDRDCLLIVDSLVTPDIHAAEAQIFTEELITTYSDSFVAMSEMELIESALNARDDAHIFIQRNDFPNSESLVHADRMTGAFANRAEVLAKKQLCFDTVTGTQTATSGISTVLNCTRMANAWARATQIAFLVLKMAKSIKENYAINTITQNKYLGSRYILDTTTQLCLAAHNNYQEYVQLQNLHDKTLFPHNCDQSRFVCIVFNRHMNLFKTWLEHINLFFNLNLTDLLAGFYPNSLSYRRVIDVIKIVEKKLNEVPERNLHEKQASFNDCSHFNLGLKFTKNRDHFTDSEKQALYCDFGRVLRHFFIKNESPFEKMLTLKSQMDTQLADIKTTASPKDRKKVSYFLSTYFEYIKIIHDMYIFIYYARVYQFIMEAARVDFLESSRSVRTDLQRAMFSVANYNEVIEEIKLLLEQLDDEEALLHATDARCTLI